jgi:hypothetical protein
MQVGLAADVGFQAAGSVEQKRVGMIFALVSKWFSITAIVVIVIMVLVLFGLFVAKIVDEWIFALKDLFRKRKKKKDEGGKEEV